ncbi:MAG: prolipoprotein diacylglyceryl transferase [Patescibacteria group bacterium]|nr:prolipoprotein diacylglyceryl transferase [Patescibacteria group bacterium]
MFLHNYNPSPLIFSFSFIQIYWYGFFISIGILAGLIIVLKLAEKYKINRDKFLNLGVYLVIFGLLGARIYSVILDFRYYLEYPINVFKIWQGGLAIHGAIIGGLVAGYIYAKKQKLNFRLVADISVVAVALGQAIGRWGNYFNQEVFGKPTNLPWGIPIEKINRPDIYQSAQYFHPTFLYESILNFINFLILLFLHKKRLSKNKRSKFFANGNIFLVYLINYSLIRFAMEFIRVDETLIILNFRLPQLLSVALFILSLILLFINSKRNVK